MPINKISFLVDQRTKRIQKMNDVVLTDRVGTSNNDRGIVHYSVSSFEPPTTKKNWF